MWRYSLWLWRPVLGKFLYIRWKVYVLRNNSSPCGDKGYYFCLYCHCVLWATWHRAKLSALLQKGTSTPKCNQGTCKTVNFTVLKPSNWTQGQIISIKIDDQGLDPGVYYTLR
jgi:hypothetical protein